MPGGINGLPRYLVEDTTWSRLGLSRLRKMRAREKDASVLHLVPHQRKPEGVPTVYQKLFQFPPGPRADESQPPAGIGPWNLSPQCFRGIGKLPDLYQDLGHTGGFLELLWVIESI